MIWSSLLNDPTRWLCVARGRRSRVLEFRNQTMYDCHCSSSKGSLEGHSLNQWIAANMWRRLGWKSLSRAEFGATELRKRTLQQIQLKQCLNLIGFISWNIPALHHACTGGVLLWIPRPSWFALRPPIQWVGGDPQLPWLQELSWASHLGVYGTGFQRADSLVGGETGVFPAVTATPLL